MKALNLWSGIALIPLLSGCAISQPVVPKQLAGDPHLPAMCTSASGSQCTGVNVNSETPVALCASGSDCAKHAGALSGAEIGLEKNAPFVEGHPLTSVVVTQCNLMVVVYMTMPDGRFLRFDKQSNVPAEELLRVAYTASRSERVEVSCDGVGVAGFEKHEAV